MDKIKKYQNIVISFLNERAKSTLGSNPNIVKRVIADKENNHFQLLKIGWNNQDYRFFVPFHLDTINGKIWLQRNQTEFEVVDFLMENGVPKEDIVLGIKPPYARKHTGFAEA